jgi:hypothetical protein
MKRKVKAAVEGLQRLRMLREGKCCRHCHADCNAPHFIDDVCLRWYGAGAGAAVRGQVNWRSALGREEAE